MSNPEDINGLLNAVRNGSAADPDAQWQAAIALGNVQLPANRQLALQALIEVLANGQAHALTRTHAVESLGKLADEQAIPTLTSALRDPYRLVRAYAANSVGALGSSEAIIQLLLDLLDSDDYFGVRAEAAAAAVNAALRQSDAALRIRVREALVRRRETESASDVPGTIRVIAEIDRSLARLDSA